MNAVLCEQFGPPETLVLTDVAPPQPGAGEVVIDVKACGLNFPDTLMIEGKYQIKPPLPFSPGGEVAGLVSAVGEGVTSVRVGDRVVALTGYGGFAEQTRASATSTYRLPEDIDYVTAASTIYNGATAYHALHDRATLQPGETLLVMGAGGGVGLAAVQLGKLMGARVIAAASTDEKLARCQQAGAADTINYATDDLRERVKLLTDGRGVDVVFDPVGASYAEAAVRSLAWRGRYLIVGFAGGSVPAIPLNVPLLKGASLVGVFWSAFARQEPARSRQIIAQLLDWIQRGDLRQPLYGQFPLAESPALLRAMLNRQIVGKAVIVP